MGKTFITGKGVKTVDYGEGFVIPENAGNVGFSPFSLKTGSVGEAFSALVPGFYYVSGSTLCTGSVAAANNVPGAQLHLTVTNGNGAFLTGSARASGVGGVFFSNMELVSGSTRRGDGLTIPAYGSVSLQSNGRYWILYAASGSITFVP